MKTQKNLYLLLALSIISITGIIIGLLNKWAFTFELYIGLAFLISCFVVLFKFKKNYNYYFGLILIFSTFNGFQFVPFQIGFGIGFLKFQLIPFPILLIFCYAHKSRILDLIQSINAESEEEKANDLQSRYEKFKIDFENLSDSEIENRLGYNLTPEAKKALLTIKEERENKNLSN